jgi:hypothetical protein
VRTCAHARSRSPVASTRIYLLGSFSGTLIVALDEILCTLPKGDIIDENVGYGRSLTEFG